MKSRLASFNIYFALTCLVLAGGCALLKQAGHGKKGKEEQSTIRLYLEGEKADPTTTGTVYVTSHKFPFTVEREPFLDESDLTKATIVDNPDGSFYIQLLLNDHGTLLLDMYTAGNRGRHIIVFTQFPKPGYKAPKPKIKTGDTEDDADLVESSGPPPAPAASTNSEPRQSGWIAAVLIRERISNGIFRFTPDATRTEGLRIVRGLRNVIAEAKKNEEF